MTVPGDRNPDLQTIVGTIRTELAALKSIVVGRWGRVPIVSADPISPPDGTIWVRSDKPVIRFSSGGANRAAGTVLCTSTTRPTGADLYNGLTAYEIDTKRFIWYDGVGWQDQAKPWSLPRGIVVEGSSSTPQTVAGTTPVSVLSTSWTAEANRYHEMRYTCVRLLNNAAFADTISMQWRNAASAPVANLAIQIIAAGAQQMLTAYMTYGFNIVGAGAWSVWASTVNPAGSMTFQAGTYESRLTVFDVGPIGATPNYLP